MIALVFNVRAYANAPFYSSNAEGARSTAAEMNAKHKCCAQTTHANQLSMFVFGCLPLLIRSCLQCDHDLREREMVFHRIASACCSSSSSADASSADGSSCDCEIRNGYSCTSSRLPLGSSAEFLSVQLPARDDDVPAPPAQFLAVELPVLLLHVLAGGQ